MTIKRLIHQRILQSIRRGICDIIVRRIWHLELALFIQQPMSRYIISALLQRMLHHTQHNRRIVSVIPRRTYNVRRVYLLLDTAHKRGSILLQCAVPRERRALRRYHEHIVTGTPCLANQHRVRTRRKINILRAIRQRLQHLSARVIRIRSVLVELISLRTRRRLHNWISRVRLRRLTRGKR